jgi:hypothetical protein
LSTLVATFSCFHFTPGLAFGEKDIGHPAITEYLSLTRQGKLRNRKIILERKQTFYGNQFLSDLTYFCRPIRQNRHFSGTLVYIINQTIKYWTMTQMSYFLCEKQFLWWTL